MGHTNDVMTRQPEAIERLLTYFFDTGEVDDSLFTYEPITFEVKAGFPAIAKIALGFAFLGVPIIVFGLWKLTKRFMNRRKK